MTCPHRGLFAKKVEFFQSSNKLQSRSKAQPAFSVAIWVMKEIMLSNLNNKTHTTFQHDSVSVRKSDRILCFDLDEQNEFQENN